MPKVVRLNTGITINTIMSFSSSISSLLIPSPTRWGRTIRNPILVLQLVLASMAMMMLPSCQANNLHPIILVPGSGGNQLEARLTTAYRPSSLFCDKWYPMKKSPDGWFRLWFDPTIVFSPFTKCFADRMMLYYDSELHDYRNAPGLETRVPYFGSTKSLLYLHPHLKHITGYMSHLVKNLEELGYVDGENMFGAPYDFRYGLAPEGNPARVGTTFLNDLKTLIEHAYALNEGNKVILLSHSLGGLFVHQLLSRTAQPWRKKYVKHFIAVSVPWGGTVEQMLTFASGNTMGIPFANPLIVRNEQRSSESNLWLLPSPRVFPEGKKLLVTKNASYSGADIPRYLEDIGLGDKVYLYKSRILPMLKTLSIPSKVSITCIIGSGIKTPETLIYGENGLDERPEIVYGDGDGTVNMMSLMALEYNMKNVRQEAVKVIKVGGISHTAMLKDRVALRKVIGEINGINSVSSASSPSRRSAQ